MRWLRNIKFWFVNSIKYYKACKQLNRTQRKINKMWKDWWENYGKEFT